MLDQGQKRLAVHGHAAGPATDCCNGGCHAASYWLRPGSASNSPGEIRRDLRPLPSFVQKIELLRTCALAQAHRTAVDRSRLAAGAGSTAGGLRQMAVRLRHLPPLALAGLDAVTPAWAANATGAIEPETGKRGLKMRARRPGLGSVGSHRRGPRSVRSTPTHTASHTARRQSHSSAAAHTLHASPRCTSVPVARASVSRHSDVAIRVLT